MASLAAAIGRGTRKGGRDVKAQFGSLAERLVEVAPRLPVRDLGTLRKQFPDLGPEEIADKLIAGATRSTATVGAGVGVAAMLPVPPAMTAELLGETFAVAVIEYKLIAELHEVYGLRYQGTPRKRASVYLAEWSNRRGISVTSPGTLNTALGSTMKKELRQQLLKRTGRNLPTLAPFMIGAAVGGLMNRRDTGKLAERVRADLRAHRIDWDALPPAVAEQRPDEPPVIEP